MFRHMGDQSLIILAAGKPELFECPVAGAQNLVGREAEHAQ